MFGRKKKKQTPALFGSRIEPDCAYCAFHADGVQKKCLAGQLGGEIFTVHRLDRAVSGVMLFSRDRRVTGRLTAAVQAHRLHPAPTPCTTVRRTAP